MVQVTTCDVLVVGGGNAALCAAIVAREQGADVVMLERSDRRWRGGNSKYTRNIRCVVHGDTAETSYLEDEFLADLAAATGPGSNRRLTELVIEKSVRTPAWMQGQGIRWQQALNGTLSLARTNRFFLGGGKALVNAYYSRALDLGVRVLYGSTAYGLRLEESACSEVDVESNGERYSIRPSAVVIASGGFEANREWLSQYWGDAARNIFVRGARQNDGLMLRCLLDAGAASCSTGRGLHAIAVDARGPTDEGGIVTRIDSIPLSIVVNRDARRFYDEGEDLWPKRYATWGRLIIDQPDQIAYSIFDSKSIGTFMTTMFPPYEVRSLVDLAAMCGLEPGELQETVAEYNAAVVPGDWDPQILDSCHTVGLEPQKSHWALKLDSPPFYAYPLRPGITFTYLGVEVDHTARIVRKRGGAFDNVFAAGEIMAGNILRQGYLAGLGMTIGTVCGRIAGSEAAALGH